VTSAVVLSVGSHVTLGAACYPDVTFCVPAELCGVTCTVVLRHIVLTATEDLKYDVKFVVFV